MPTGTALHDRLRSVAGERSYRVLADLTGTNSETVRRYMTGQAPSIEFVTAFCRVFRVNHEWLLTGKGPARARELRGAILSEASVSELLDALARSLEQLTDRVERLERFVHTMETRLRAGGAPSASIEALRVGVADATTEPGTRTRGAAMNGDAGGPTDDGGSQAGASKDRAGIGGDDAGIFQSDGRFAHANNGHDAGAIKQAHGAVEGPDGGGADGDGDGDGDGGSGGGGVGVRVRAVADAVVAQRPRPGAG